MIATTSKPISSAAAWLQSNPQRPGLDVVFEVVAITGGRLERRVLGPESE